MLHVVALIATIGFVILSTTVGRLHPFVALILASFGFGIATGMPLDLLLNAVNSGFGDTIAYIGIVIVAGSIIGTLLQRSGAAGSIAAAVLRITGPRRVPLAMGLLGYIVSMPVYCDTGYILLSPINRGLARTAGISVAGGAIALSLGLYATHTMVPPTPGPVAAAGILHADLGLVIVWGLIVSLIALAGGLTFVYLYVSRVQLSAPEEQSVETTALTQDTPPSVQMSLLPIVVPITLIVGRSVSLMPGKPFGDGTFAMLCQNIGQPAIALLIGVALALFLPIPLNRDVVSESGWFGEAIRNSALIIVITGAGGAFGRVLQNSGIADIVGASTMGQEYGLLLPFILAAVIKTAQGSSTVAIVTTASIIAPLLGSLELDSEQAKALTVVAIGAGSMVVSHANDSYFWVVTQFTGMTVKQGYQLQSAGTAIQGLVAATVVMVIGAWLS